MHGTLILPEGATLDTVLFDWPGMDSFFITSYYRQLSVVSKVKNISFGSPEEPTS